MRPLYSLLRRLKEPTGWMVYGRELIAGWAAPLPGDPFEVLDVGCRSGDDLLLVAEAAAPREARLHGVDIAAGMLEAARASGIATEQVDIERERLPFADESFDFVICNQVLEHTKEIFWIVSEVHRVLRVGGHVAVGVPNLASLHNRVLLLLGDQPSAIEPLGPHVRAFTRSGLRRFLEAGGLLEIVDERGAAFYPLPPAAASRMARLWPGGAVSLFVLARKVRPGSFVDVLPAEAADTAYFTG